MSKIRFVIYLILVFAVLIFRFVYYYQHLPQYKDKQAVKFNTKIVSEPADSGRVQRFIIKLPDGRAVFITTNKYPFYSYGQNVEITGKLQVKVEEGATFYSMSFPKIKIGEEEKNIIFSFALAIRNKAITLFNSVLSPIHSALLAGIVFGIKQQMPDEFYKQLQSAGVMHVIAASGMNVSMVSGAIFYIFQRFLNRRLAIVLSILSVSMYTVIAGMEPSIVRAAIMAIFTFSAGLTGRQKLPYYVLCLTAIVMLLYSPSYLTDVGFQLSFLATLGILYLKQIFSFLENGLFGKLVGEDLTTTLAAQLATMPVLLINFGSVNIISVLVNTVILWTIPILTVFGAISIIFAFIYEPVSRIIIYLTIPFLWLFERAVVFFAGINLPLEVDIDNNIFWLGYYLLLTAVVSFVLKHKEGKT